MGRAPTPQPPSFGSGVLRPPSGATPRDVREIFSAYRPPDLLRRARTAASDFISTFPDENPTQYERGRLQLPSPKPIPTEVKRMMGNPGKRKLPKPGEEPNPEIVKTLPPPPDWLGEFGAKEWERVGPVLAKMRLLSESDLIAFGAYCANVDLMIESKLDIQKNGTTIRGARGDVRNPALASFSQAVTALRALATEFGMTPSSRARMKLPGDDGESLADLMADDESEDVS